MLTEREKEKLKEARDMGWGSQYLPIIDKLLDRIKCARLHVKNIKNAPNDECRNDAIADLEEELK